MRADWPIVAFSAALSVLVSLVLAVPACARLARQDHSLAVRGTVRSSSGTVGKPLLVAQSGLVLVLLVSAVVLTRTVVNLGGVSVGFDADRLAVFSVEPARSGYDRPRAAQLYERIEAELRRLPGVEAVSISGSGSGILWGTDSNADVYFPADAGAQQASGEAKFQFVDPSFLDAIGMRLLAGRSFTNADVTGAPPVALVNEAFVKKYFGGANPNARVTSLRETVSPMFFRPLAQTPSPSRTVIVRTSGDAEAILPDVERVMQQIEPRLPLRNLRTQRASLDEYTRDERLLASAAVAAGAGALTVSMIGLFGLMSYAVARRTREIGIRMAVGAEPRTVRRAVIGETLAIIATGIVVGVPAFLLAARFLETRVYGLSPRDPASLAASAALLVLVAMTAAYGPARRASRVEPTVALRAE
jgi:hypothetical protein